MAKKKSAKKTSVPKEFSNSPFKSLKGLSAFEEQQAASEQPRPVNAETETTARPDAGNFAEEMDFLGVKPLPGRTIDEAAEQVVQPAPSLPPRAATDESLFLEAVGSMEKVFKDEWSQNEAAKKAVPRRMKQVEKGQLKPEAELDLHGLTVDEATDKVRFFLQDAMFHGFRTVLVVTGKGLHSEDGPVLRQAVERLLADQRDQVIEWGVAPRRLGGDGALVVFMRSM